MDQSRRVNTDPRRDIPSVDRLTAAVLEQNSTLPRWATVEAARQVVAEARLALTESRNEGKKQQTKASVDDSAVRAARLAAQLVRPHPGRVVNATGVVLHTNLGRAPMAAGAAAAAAEAAAGYSDLELDLASGGRGDRLGALATKLRLLSGAEAAYACNNNAAAVLLVLNTLAAGREVIVSRGELVEIGGSFRVPEIMRRAGVRLVEVGSTNRTHASDYEQAIGSETGLLLKVHRSNFELRGFVKEVSLGELVALGREHGVPVAEDLGSGTLLDLRSRGLPEDSWVPGRLREEPDVICFSGDKLMGGPQAGIVLGRSEAVTAMRKNPLARALRLDKMTLAALDWTLAAMLDGRAEYELPVVRQLLEPSGHLQARAAALAKALAERVSAHSLGAEIGVKRDRVPVGGGSLPGFELESWVLEVRTSAGAERVAARLREHTPPVLVRVRDDAVLLDLRTVADRETDTVIDALTSALH
ncbi:MAG: L-seryl-tRNA(Sec) selenium transferase [Deltaproteobacteria bacterium]|nr:L-seryl-tRNA(Sec) selenium transferase [Deltaproteobacteria bacterium]MBW2382311.1 L-seryl-tRNA(Sec) selenium transferase [Deltaproteobacteria bacterium]